MLMLFPNSIYHFLHCIFSLSVVTALFFFDLQENMLLDSNNVSSYSVGKYQLKVNNKTRRITRMDVFLVALLATLNIIFPT